MSVHTLRRPTAPSSCSVACAFELAGVARSFGPFTALAGIDLRILEGERVAILGPSGAGKSTLLRLLNTSLRPSAGRLRILGQDPQALGARRLRALRARIGTVYQQLHLVLQASALENVLMGGLGVHSALRVALGALRAADREAAAAALARVGIDSRIDERVERLSGGEQQRVAVARVLHQGPEVVLADEPFASVDPARSAEVVRVLLEAAEGRTVVLSTHQLEPILPHFPRIVGLRAGRVLFDRSTESLTRDDLAALYRPEGATSSPDRPRSDRAPGTRAGGRVRVGASTTPGEYVVSRVVARFAREHPSIAMSLTVKDTLEVTRDLLDREVDVAFVGSRRPHADLHYEDWLEDEILLVAAPDFAGLPDRPLAPSEAARLPRVQRETGSATRALVEEQLASMGVLLDPGAVIFEAGSIESLKTAVAAGAGVAFVSRLAVTAELRSGRLRAVPVESVRLPRRVYIATRRTEPLAPAASAFMEAARRAAVREAAA